MADHSSRTKRAPRESWRYQQCDGKRRSPLAGERHILELISLGAPLPGILNQLCTAIDVRIGNVVSLFLLPDGDANHLCSVTQSAMQLGLQVFSSTDVLARDATFLGTLEIYGCDPRRPTPHEYHLIERAVYLAAIALQRYGDEEILEGQSNHSRDGIGSALDRTPFIN